MMGSVHQLPSCDYNTPQSRGHLQPSNLGTFRTAQIREMCRLLEKTLSVSSGDAGSMLSGDTDVDTAPISKEEPVYHCPADVQIARLEAEAARQQELRAAKSKKLATKQVLPCAISALFFRKVLEGVTMEDLGTQCALLVLCAGACCFTCLP